MTPDPYPQESGKANNLDELIGYYSRALDELYFLRQAMAYEAEGIAVSLQLKTFPKSRRVIAENQVKRMKRAAVGEVERAYSQIPVWHKVAALERVLEEFEDKHLGLSRGQFEQEIDKRDGRTTSSH